MVYDLKYEGSSNGVTSIQHSLLDVARPPTNTKVTSPWPLGPIIMGKDHLALVI